MNNTPKSRAVWLRHSVAASSLAPHTVPAKIRRSLRMRIDYLLGLRAVVMPFAVNPPAAKVSRVAPAAPHPCIAPCTPCILPFFPRRYLAIHSLINPR